MAEAVLRSLMPRDYDFFRTTPTPIFPRSRSGYFKRAFSAAAFVLNGFDTRPLRSRSQSPPNLVALTVGLAFSS